MFIAYEITKELITALAPLVPQIKRADLELADQLKRAAQSVLLNLSEGQKFTNGNRRRHYEIAHGSANEVRAALDAAVAWGWITPEKSVLALLDRLLAVMWKLARSPALQAPGMSRCARGRRASASFRGRAQDELATRRDAPITSHRRCRIRMR